MAQTKSVITKAKKKKWYPLIAPGIFENVVLGETPVYEENTMIGKRIRQNLMNLTGDIKKQSTNIDFVVTKVENGRALTEIIGYHMIPPSVKRLTRRKSEKIELSFACHTADGKYIRIKPLIFAISDTKGSVASNLRRTSSDFLRKAIKKMTYENLINELISHNLQNSLRNHIKKIYPVRVCKVKSMYLEKEKKHQVEEESAGKEEAKGTSEQKEAGEKKAEKEPPKEKETKQEKTEAEK